MTDRFEKFSYYITEIAKLLHKIEAAEMESLGLKGPYAIYLLAIARNENGISAARLSLECGRDKGDVSRAVKAMEEKGLVRRVSDNARGYRAPIILTDEGKKAARRLGHTAGLGHRKKCSVFTDGIVHRRSPFFSLQNYYTISAAIYQEEFYEKRILSLHRPEILKVTIDKAAGLCYTVHDHKTSRKGRSYYANRHYCRRFQKRTDGTVLHRILRYPLPPSSFCHQRYG
jgi:DNA-binding MarR family transcriptional regulator